MTSAIIRTGGQQYSVAEGDVLRIAHLAGDAGSASTFGEVLALGGEKSVVGQPLVKGAKVSAEIVRQERGEKLVVFKFRRRKRFKRKNGHRQDYTMVKITSISA
jgi:large subunit ribosomal protein L21